MDSFHIWQKWSLAWDLDNDLWPWPISSRSLNHEFAIGLLKYGTSYSVCSAGHTVLDGLFPYLAHTITSTRECVVHNNLWPWPVSSRSFSHDSSHAIKLLRYGTSCRVRSTACTVLDGFFLYLAQMIIIMRGCVDWSKDMVARDLWDFAVGAVGILVDHRSIISSISEPVWTCVTNHEVQDPIHGVVKFNLSCGHLASKQLFYCVKKGQSCICTTWWTPPLPCPV